MRKLLLSISTLLVLSATAGSQQVRPATSAQIYHEISQLQNLVSVLYIAAHPDDENTRLLAWLVNDQHIRTAYLSLTRGDGGQNIIGSEKDEALGMIRTHELMEARKLDGAEQFFTRAVDFGFSKTSEETFRHWNPDLITGDVVWVMRKFRPDVVICRFPPTADAGHGQHAASAVIAKKAFLATGKKDKYKEQLTYYKPWQPKRLLFNAYKFGSRNTITEDMFPLETGQYSPLLGIGYGELAGQSRSIHRSQGAGTPSIPGVQTEYFDLVAGEDMKQTLFDGIDITWNRVNRPDIDKKIEAILDEFSFKKPEKSLPALLALRRDIRLVKNEFWRAQKLAELDKIILHCSGFMAEVYARQPTAVAGDKLPFTLKIIARAGLPVSITSINWLNNDVATAPVKFKSDSLITIDHDITIPANTPPTEPYWLTNTSIDKGSYIIPYDSLLGLPEAPNHLNVQLVMKIDEELFEIDVPLSYKKLDPTRGDVVEPLRIVPDVTLNFTSAVIVTEVDGSLKTKVRIMPHKDINNAILTVSERSLVYRSPAMNLKAGKEVIIPINIDADRVGRMGFFLTAMIMVGEKSYARSQYTIQYNHIPTLQYFKVPYTKVVRNNWKVAAKKIGYVEGAGDNIASILKDAGLNVTVLTDADMEAGKLRQYDAIITGIRSVNTEKRMAQWMGHLLQYAENGGTLVMQYNTLQDMATTGVGPYPIKLSDKRVTEEDAKVTLLNPEHRLLTYPNKITDDDFKGWVQERGLYFPITWDEQYEALFAMNDAKEQPLKGSTLYAKYGKGHYIYTSLSFFRQLPAGNNGAMRLLMNMLSVGN
ncbi:MAG: PIG-L family deacetylase [Flavipsychrobacter sp.]|nr:PIG-L family deacetylase [Flavipsychrobacter sp.]